MKKRQEKIIFALTLTAFFLAFLASGRLWLRLDLTKNKAYTLTDITRNLYLELNEPVIITYYVSDRLKTMSPSPAEIEDTLREYVTYSRGSISLNVRDPVKANLSAVIEELGVFPMQVQTVEQDSASFITVYSGIVIEYMERTEILPWVISTDTLEYDLTSRIRSMARDTWRQIGIIVGSSFHSWEDDFTYLYLTLLNAGYRVVVLYPGESIPDALDALFVLGGAETFDDAALYRIDRFIQAGGRVLFAADSVFVDAVYGSLDAFLLPNKGLLDMIASYGAIIRPELALDRACLTMQYQGYSVTGGLQYKSARYPPWIAVLGENINGENPLTAGLYGIDLFWASPIELYERPGVASSVLFESTPQSWLMRENFYTNPDILYLMELEAAQTTGKKILGVFLSGTFPSFFKGAPKPEPEDFFDELPDMPQAALPSRIIVIADTDFATDLVYLTQSSHNLDFLLRAADYLLYDDDIIGIRARAPHAGRLDKISDIDGKNAAMRFIVILNIAVVPLCVILAGVFLYLRRKRRSQRK